MKGWFGWFRGRLWWFRVGFRVGLGLVLGGSSFGPRFSVASRLVGMVRWLDGWDVRDSWDALDGSDGGYAPNGWGGRDGWHGPVL